MVRESAGPVHPVVLPLAGVAIAVGPVVASVAFFAIMLHAADINALVRVDSPTFAVFMVFVPVALVLTKNRVVFSVKKLNSKPVPHHRDSVFLQSFLSLDFLFLFLRLQVLLVIFILVVVLAPLRLENWRLVVFSLKSKTIYQVYKIAVLVKICHFSVINRTVWKVQTPEISLITVSDQGVDLLFKIVHSKQINQNFKQK